MNRELIYNSNLYNKNMSALIESIDDIKKNNNRILSMYLQSKDNLSDINNNFDDAEEIIELASTSSNTEVYMKIIDMYNTTSSYLDRILLDEKTIKNMNSEQFNNYISVLEKGKKILNDILAIPKIEKNPNITVKMKPRYKYLDQRIAWYKKHSKYKKKQKEEQPKENKKHLLKKGLCFASGFVVGAGVSCVPGCGYLRMGLAATKVATSAINAWALKHPKGILSKTLMSINAKMSPKSQNFINKLKDKSVNNGLNIFINGLAVGYIAGNVFELATGETLLEFTNDKLNETQHGDIVPSQTVAQTSRVETTTTPESIETTPTTTGEITTSIDTTTIDQPIVEHNIIDTTVIDNEIIPNVPDFNPEDLYGQKLDVSSLTCGYQTCLDPLVGKDPVTLYTDLGHDVHIGNEKILSDGTRMWALFQDDGTGYAWFKADDVISAVNTQDNEMVLKLIK